MQDILLPLLYSIVFRSASSLCPSVLIDYNLVFGPTDHVLHATVLRLSSGIQDARRRRRSNRRDTVAADTRIRRIRLTTQRRSVRAPAACLPWLRGRGGCLTRHKLRFDEHRDDRTGGQAESLVTEDTEERAAFARVGGDTDDGGRVGGEEFVEDDLGAVVLGLCEASLN